MQSGGFQETGESKNGEQLLSGSRIPFQSDRIWGE